MLPLLALTLAVLAALAAALFHQFARSDRAHMRRRLNAMALSFASRGGAGGVSEGVMRRRLIQAKLRELENQRQRARRDTVPQLLLQSGLALTLRGFMAGSMGLAAAVGGIAWLAGLPPLLCPLPAAGAGLLLPRMALRIVIRRRQARFTQHFADALDILVRGVRSGLPVGESLRIVARESPDPVGPEFQFLNESQRVGMTLKQALERGLERMPVTEMQFFAIVLLIQQQTGGNLAATLDNLSGVLRGRKRLRDKIAALSSEAKASAAIIGSLPFLVCGGLALVNPDYIGLLFSERMGHVMLVGGLLWMMTGVLVMRKMINFDF